MLKLIKYLEIKWGEWLLFSSIAILLIFTSWHWAGARSPQQNYLPALAFFSLGMLFVSSIYREELKVKPVWRPLRMLGRVICDPMFMISLVFILFLVIQWKNSPRSLVFSPPDAKWIFSPPPHAEWPSSVLSEESREMINWFLPALVIGLCVRQGVFSRREAKRYLSLILLNGALMAIFGLMLFTTVVHETNVEHAPKYFGMFGYQNHSGMYFVLLLCLAGGRLITCVNEKYTRKRKRRQKLILYTLVLILFYISAIASISRTSILLATGILLLIFIFCFKRLREELITPSRIYNASIFLVGLILIAFFLAAGSNPRRLFHELKDITPQRITGEFFAEGRHYQYNTAIAIWKDHKWFGVGGWGYRHFISFYMDREDFHLMQPGAANVHCDLLQFLTEFGIIGFSLMGFIAISIWFPLLKRFTLQNRESLLIVLGLVLMIAVSFIDLPFRNALLLQHWILISSILSSKSFVMKKKAKKSHY